MSDPTDHLATVRAAPVTNQNDHLTAVRAALDLMLRVWPGSLDVRRFVDDTGNDAAAVIDKATGETIAICDNEDRDDHAAPAEDAAAIVALRNAAPAIAALADECERLRAAVSALDLKVADTVRRWDEASDEERIRREAIERELADSDADRRRHFATLCRERDINMEARARIATLEAELAQARAHRCGGIVLSAEDADRIAALLEDPPAPTPAMVALFAKAKE